MKPDFAEQGRQFFLANPLLIGCGCATPHEKIKAVVDFAAALEAAWEAGNSDLAELRRSEAELRNQVRRDGEAYEEGRKAGLEEAAVEVMDTWSEHYGNDGYPPVVREIRALRGGKA